MTLRPSLSSLVCICSLLALAYALPQLETRQEAAPSDEPTSGLTPSSTQKVTLGVIAGYTAFIAIGWSLWGLRSVLYPFKLMTVMYHELSHAFVGLCTGGRIKSIELDPNQGGKTVMTGGWQPAGTASIVLGLSYLMVLWWARRNWLTIVTVLLAAGLLVACWFIADAQPLRFLVLFYGVMSCLYSVWDIFDDLVLRKVNESDASVFAKRYGGSSQCYGVIWAMVSFTFMILGILAGLAAFKQSFAEQRTQSDAFIKPP